MSRGSRHRTLVALSVVGAVAHAACEVPEPTSPPFVLAVTRDRPPPKPGESITKTKMCSCTRCEPAGCCAGTAAEQSPADDATCRDGFDFTECALAVKSCEGNCFLVRWRAEVSDGCERGRPEHCCPPASQSGPFDG